MEDKFTQADWSEICDGIKNEAKITQRVISSLSAEEGMSDLLLKHINYMVRREGNMIGHLNDYRKKNEDYRRLLSVKEMNIGHMEKQTERIENKLVVAKGKESELQHIIADMSLTIDELKAKCAETETMEKLRSNENHLIIRNLEEEIRKLKTNIKQLEQREMNAISLCPSSDNLVNTLVGNKMHQGNYSHTSFSTEDIRLLNNITARPNFLPIGLDSQRQDEDTSTSSQDTETKIHFVATSGRNPDEFDGMGRERGKGPKQKTDAILKAEKRSTLLKRFEQTII